jgi:hypothetical protein
MDSNIDTIAKFVLHEFGKEHMPLVDSPDSVLSYLEARIEALSNTTNTDSLEFTRCYMNHWISKAPRRSQDALCVGDMYVEISALDLCPSRPRGVVEYLR